MQLPAQSKCEGMESCDRLETMDLSLDTCNVDAPSWPAFGSSPPYWPDEFNGDKSSFTTTAMPMTADNVHSFEKQFCSNFSCCGSNLQSFHDLIDHFERVHVLILDSAGKPFYPEVATVPSTPPSPTTSSFSAISSGCSSGSSCRSLSPPMTSLDHEARARAQAQMRSTWPGWPNYLNQLEVRVPFPNFPHSPAPLPPWTIESSIEEYLVDMDMDSDEQSDVLPTEPPCSSSSASSSPAPSNDVLPSSDEGSISAPVSTTHNRVRSPAIRRARVGRPRHPSCPENSKERFYHCPKSGCSKKYRNPGGLKYHVEKGTCIIPDKTKM